MLSGLSSHDQSELLCENGEEWHFLVFLEVQILVIRENYEDLLKYYRYFKDKNDTFIGI